MSSFMRILLASAAGLVAVSGANAADLGAKKPTAVEYVRTCPTYGAGFFVVPGTTSCLKLIGRIRADYFVNNPTRRTSNNNRFRVRGYIGFDHRTATEYGLLRTYMRAYFMRQDGADTTVLEYAYMQFGGFTFGRADTFFEHAYNFNFAGSNDFGGFSDIVSSNVLAYTASFGKFSATLALEDQSDRIGNHRITGGSFAGKAMPDIVGRLDYKDSWGEVMVAGAVHQIRSANASIDTKYGYAVVGAAKINLPMLSRGSYIFGSAAYSEGAINYTGFTRSVDIGSYSINTDNVTVSGNSLRLAKAFGLAAGLRAFVTPTIFMGPSINYGSVDPFGGSNRINTLKATFTVGWNPVPSFLIGAEAGYQKLWAPAALLNPAPVAGNDRSNFFGRFRVQRDF